MEKNSQTEERVRNRNPVEASLVGTGWFADVGHQVRLILASASFQATGRSRRLLRFLVDETLAGRGDRLKQYIIATNVFARDDDFDPNLDPVVRTEAAKLRRSLELYYLTVGRDDPIEIVLPKGTYVVTLNRRRVRESREPPETAPGRQVWPKLGPRVAVLPLRCLVDRRDAEIFAAGLTEELIIALARFEDVQVIGHHSVLGYKSSEVGTKAAADDLQLDFMITGSVRWETNRQRVTAQLIDARTGQTVWAEAYDRALTASNVFAIQDEIIDHVTGRLGGHYGAIARSLGGSTGRSLTDRLSAYEAVLRFHAYNLQVFPSDFIATRTALREAVEIDPDFAVAWAMLSELEVDDIVFGFTDQGVGLDQALRMARLAVQLEPQCQQAQQALAYSRMHHHDFDGAIDAYEHCVALNPRAAYFVAYCGWGIALCGEWDRGLQILDHGTSLNPNKPGWMNLAPLLVNWRKGDYPAVYEAARRFNTPELAWDPLLRAATLTRLGREDDARVSIQTLLEIDPTFAQRARTYVGAFVYDEALANDIVSALQEAGLRLT